MVGTLFRNRRDLTGITGAMLHEGLPPTTSDTGLVPKALSSVRLTAVPSDLLLFSPVVCAQSHF